MLRDHLANERTLLAYVRTALALLGAGAVLWHLGDDLVGSLVAGLGIGLLGYGVRRFREVRSAIGP